MLEAWSSLSRPTVWMVDVAWPFGLLLVLVGLLWRRVHLPSWKDIPKVSTAVAICGLWALYWTAFQFGQITSDECVSLASDSTDLIKYIRGDSGLPSRLYRTLSWFVVPLGGLAILHAFSVLMSTLSTVLLTSAGYRLAGTVGAFGTFLLLTYEPWLRYNWYARSYSLFLAFSCLALWQATRNVSRDEPPELGGMLLATAVACMENPICILVALAAIVAKVRRYGIGSVPGRSWAALMLMIGACGPMVFKAISMHGNLAHQVRSETYTVLIIAGFVVLPGVLRRGRRGWISETALLTIVAVGVATGLELIPVHERAFLFSLPWVVGGVLASIRTHKIWQVVLAIVVGSVGLSENAGLLSKRLHQATVLADDARSTDAYLESVSATAVHFEPRHVRYRLTSFVADLRVLKTCDEGGHAPDLPDRYRTDDKPQCSAGEHTVTWNRKTPSCDCPMVAEYGAWRTFYCSDAASIKGMRPD